MEPLITDRTQADAQYAAANQGEPELKGAYNATDLNRVGEWANFIRGLSFMKVNWTIQDLPDTDTWNTYFSDLRTLRGIAPVYPTTPQVPSGILALLAPGGWDAANDIERMLADMNDIKSVTKKFGTFQFGGMLI